ncbi:MAG: PAS domain-containing protein [Chitinophagaceae bacterium]|nr:MAG: PAS domain-containing protein [Chitinophagaceae bacterium]
MSLVSDNRFLTGGGQAADLIRKMDWTDSPLGEPDTWPDALKTALNISLNSGFPIAIYWGKDFTLLYNDAYSSIPGDKHPWALGKKGSVAWDEIWHLIGHQFTAVLRHGESVREPNSMLPMKRHGYTEECYFDYTLSPVIDAHGKTLGVFNAVVETTYKVINERRNALLHKFSLQTSRYVNSRKASREVLSILSGERDDIPFALLYLRDPLTGEYRLTQAVNTTAFGFQYHWPFEDAAKSRGSLIVKDLDKKIPGICEIKWPEPCSEAVLLPVRLDSARIDGFLVAGVNPGKRVDNDYLQFLERLAGHVEITISQAALRENDIEIAELMQQREDELQFAVDAAELGTWDLEPESNKFAANTRLKSWFGVPSDEQVPLSMATDVIDEKDRARVLEAISHAMKFESGGLYEIEYTIRNPKNPEPRLVRAKGKALFNEKQQVIRFSGTLQDITIEHRTMSLLELANQRLEIALNAASLGSYDLDLRTGLMVCTPQCKQNFGRDPQKPFNYPDLMAAIRPEFRDDVKKRIETSIVNHSTYHAVYQVDTPEKATRWISAYGRPQYDEKGNATGMVGVTSDITSQKNSSEDLEKAYEQARLSKHAAQLGMFDVDYITNTLDWDVRCRELFGITHPMEVTLDRDFFPRLHEEDRERVRTAMEFSHDRDLSDGNYDIEYRTVSAEDGRVRWVRAKGRVFFNEKAVPLRFIGSVLEITDQKAIELRKNDFIGMVSHELKTPLTSLKAYIQLLNERAKKKEDSFELNALGKVDLQVNKMTNMINGFLNVARLESGKIHLITDSFSANNMIRELISDIEIIYTTHTIVFQPSPELTVKADREKIEQVIVNLVSNAVKYSPGGTVVDIHCRAEGDEAVITVKDEGMGIPKQDMEKMFTRFYRVENSRTKTISGFGIGLYLSAEIVKRHHGRIWVDSEKGKGSSFHFTIPLA